MPALLRTGNPSRRPPSWCAKNKWLGIGALVAGVPIRLASYARWKQDHCAVNIDLIESFQLSYNTVTTDWTGASSEEGPNLAIEICTLATPGLYDVEIHLRNNQVIVDTHCWSDVKITDKRPFDTGRLSHVIDSKNWFYEIHARG